MQRIYCRPCCTRVRAVASSDAALEHRRQNLHPAYDSVTGADLLAELQSSLGAAYTFDRELGGGGMARVFLAHERGLGRPVVIKILNPELAEGINADRFEREIRLAASLQQANIVPLLSAGRAARYAYYTMPFVEGRSLRDRLARDSVVGQASKCVDVRAVIRVRITGGLLRRHVRGGADAYPRRGQRFEPAVPAGRGERLRDPEIGDDRRSARKENVSRFDVAMHDATL